MNSPYKETILIASLPGAGDAAATSLLHGKYSTAEIEQLTLAFLADIIIQFNRFTRTRSMLYLSNPSAQELLENYYLSSVEYLHIEAGERRTLIAEAIEKGFREEHCKQLFLVLVPHPLIGTAIVEHSLRLLTLDDDSVVYGQLTNGTPYLLGMKSPHQAFAVMDNCSFGDCEKLLRQCCEIDGVIHSLPTLPVIGSCADLTAVKTAIEHLYEVRGDYPKKSLSTLRQLDELHGMKVR